MMLNAIGFRAEQGVPLSDLAPKDFAYPIATWTTSQFLTGASGGSPHGEVPSRGNLDALCFACAAGNCHDQRLRRGLCGGSRPVPHACRRAAALAIADRPRRGFCLLASVNREAAAIGEEVGEPAELHEHLFGFGRL